MADDKKMILIVEDDPDTATYLSTLLADAGYDSTLAADGDQALEQIELNPPDLVSLDITMPNKSGVRLYRDIKESNEWQGIPVIIVTGVSGDFENFISTRRQVPPPEGYVPKPIDRDKFLAAVEQNLGS